MLWVKNISTPQAEPQYDQKRHVYEIMIYDLLLT